MGVGTSFQVGNVVGHPCVDGYGRVGAVTDSRVRVDSFESIAQPVAASEWVEASECKRLRLAVQTRVFFKDGLGHWRAGRVVGGDPPLYFVRLPNSDYDLKVSEDRLFVRWTRPVLSPLDVLIARGNESPYFRDARAPLMRSLVDQWSACAGATSLLSSGVELHSHQVAAAMTVLADPVQRYLLADEVGLGKTIEAGFVIRQRLIDKPNSRIAVIAPDVLRRQWDAELTDKFFVGDFPKKTLRISAHETPERWAEYAGFDLVVVDEAHQLIDGVTESASPYRELASLCHSSESVLLLSATPIMRRESTHLGLLHLLDPHVYRWQDLEGFRAKLAIRKELGRAAFSIDSDLPFLLPDAIGGVLALLPEDARAAALADKILLRLDAAGDLRPGYLPADLNCDVEAFKGHLSETYRLHRRVIRSRRSVVLTETADVEGLESVFEVTGRASVELIESTGHEHSVGREVLGEWADLAVAAADNGYIEDLLPYVDLLSVLTSKVGGPIDDLVACLETRLRLPTGRAEAVPDLREQEILLRAPLLDGEMVFLEQLRAVASTDGLEDHVAAMIPVLRASRRAIIFCGTGVLAPDLAAVLRGRFPRAKFYLHSVLQGSEASEQAIAEWRDGGVLIADSSAEDGRNLQVADAVVHLRLPRTANAMEQRIGRVDRYGSGSAATQHFVGSNPEELVSALDVWFLFLRDAFGVFSQSISALQDSADGLTQVAWRAALQDRTQAATVVQDEISSALVEATRDNELMDALEQSAAFASGRRNILRDLLRVDLEWRSIESPTMEFVASKQGLRLGVVQKRGGVIEIGDSRAEPLISPILLNRIKTVVPETRRGTFDRWAAMKQVGARVFRVGNPLIDRLWDVLRIEDRGQASAHWRVDSTVGTDPEVYLGMDFLIEADTETAVALTDGSDLALRAVERRANQAFAPIHATVWVNALSGAEVLDPRRLRWLEAPYRNSPGDRNLSGSRFDELASIVGGEDALPSVLESAASSANDALIKRDEIQTALSEASDRAVSETVVLRAQAQSRIAAGRLVSDTEGLVLDHRLLSALREGIEQPTVRVLAVSCIVRSPVALGQSFD
ncbi:restriction endonuclease subunit R [Aeromicrobium sp. A1-2]|uniref:protein DpdE n=1 Tax=Aeromicrobium sp. A1-2 TaxID=2107713 RepID=UPI000E4EC047|nr:protein DpdE [Aeromicrobium sp. A1-2]AXT85135.1 restriction endonuclease subunit R [Aeromicrobium sp. A1-2]